MINPGFSYLPRLEPQKSPRRSKKILSQTGIAVAIILLGHFYFLIFSQTTGGRPRTRPSSPGARPSPRVPVLEPYTPAEHLVMGGETNEFRILAAGDEYLRISVAQHDAALSVSLLAPDGQEILKTNNSNGKLQRLVFSALATQPGTYRLVLQPTLNAYDRVTINIEEQRAATPSDRQRVTIERTLLEAEQLRVQGSMESTIEAIRAYETVLTFWRQAGSRRDEARTLTTLGELNAAIDLRERALGFLNQALPIWQATGEVHQAANTLTDIGLIYKRMDQRLKALNSFQQSLTMWRALGDQAREASVLENLGATYATFGDTRKSLDKYSEALQIWREMGNREAEAFTYVGIGQLFDTPRDYSLAGRYYYQALRLWSQEDDPFGKDYMSRKLSSVSAREGLQASSPGAVVAAGPPVTGAAAGTPTSGAEITGGRRGLGVGDAPIEELHWRQLDSFNDPVGYDVYLKHFPNGRFANQAKNRLRDFSVSPNDRASFNRTTSPVPPDVKIEREPMMEMADPIIESKEFDVLVSLTAGTNTMTPDVKVTQGGTKTPGQIELQLPDVNGWTIEVLLLAPDFVSLNPRANLVLPATGDSKPARFKLTPKPIRGPQQTSKISATFWYNGGFLGRIERDVTVVRADAVQQPPPPPADRLAPPAIKAAEQKSGIVLNSAQKIPDLTITTFRNPTSKDPDERFVITRSRYGEPTLPQIYSQKDLSNWLIDPYREFSQKSTQLAELNTPAKATERAKVSEATKNFIRGFTAELYEKFCPPSVKAALWEVSGNLGPDFKTIKIVSDDFDLPWELMRPINASGEELGLLGTQFEIGRWHMKLSGQRMPPQQVSIDKVVVIAPQYGTGMQGQQPEIDALKSMSGYEPWPGKLEDMKKLFQDFPLGIIYFAGHGSMRATEGNLYQYAIQLEDGTLDVTTWRGLITAPSRNHPLFFFNACSVGQTQNIANFVDGWAPAVLDAGASGYVGSLWPTSQRGAGDFGATFSREFDRRLKIGPASVAQTLMETRRKFLDNGDPTFLAYVYFGDPDLELVRAPK